MEDVRPNLESGKVSQGPAIDKVGDPVIDPTKNVLDLVTAAIQRQDDLRSLDNKWRDFVDNLRAYHIREMRKAEADRIDAIRAVDVSNVQQASVVAENRATTLANTVAATASAFDAKLTTELAPIKKDISDLRQVQYEGVGGKTQIKETQARTSNSGVWIGLGIGIAAGLVGAVSMIVAIIKLGSK